MIPAAGVSRLGRRMVGEVRSFGYGLACNSRRGVLCYRLRSKASGLPHKVTKDLINDPSNNRRMAGRRALNALCGETCVGLGLLEMEQ
jgi:hypothetical protein